MANWKEIKSLRDRYSLLSDWYGSEFAVTEFAASIHTPKARKAAEVLKEVLCAIKAPESKKIVQVKMIWQECIGKEFARFTTPSYIKNDTLYVEVQHSALVFELRPIINELCERINERLGEKFCTTLKLIPGKKKN